MTKNSVFALQIIGLIIGFYFIVFGLMFAMSHIELMLAMYIFGTLIHTFWIAVRALIGIVL